MAVLVPTSDSSATTSGTAFNEQDAERAAVVDVDEMLEMAQVSDEAVQFWQKQEQRMLQTIVEAKVPEDDRATLLRNQVLPLLARLEKALPHCAAGCGLMAKSVMLIDVTFAKACAEQSLDVKDVAVWAVGIAVAAFSLAFKMIFQWSPDSKHQILLEADPELAGLMLRTAPELPKFESEILSATSWQINAPTAEMWLNSLCTRTAILGGQDLQRRIPGLFAQGVEFLRACMGHTLRRKPSERLGQRELAAGVFLVGLVRAGLLPLGLLKPEAAQVEPVSPRYEDMLKLLQRATLLDVPALQRGASCAMALWQTLRIQEQAAKAAQAAVAMHSQSLAAMAAQAAQHAAASAAQQGPLFCHSV